MMTMAWVSVLASAALVTHAQVACAAHDETCLLQVSSSLAVNRGSAVAEPDDLDLSKIPARGIRRHYDENDVLDSAYTGVGASNSTTQTCPFEPAHGIGKITIGVIYHRKETVNKAIAKKFPNMPNWLVGKVGEAARSKKLGATLGGGYDDVNTLIVQQAQPMIVQGLAGAHLTIVPSGTAACNPQSAHAACPPKHGAILMEFLVCGPSAAQEDKFQCCNVFGGQTAADATRLRGWARAVGDQAFKWFSKADKAIANARGSHAQGHLGIVGGQMINGLVDALPGQLMAGLEAADVGQPNIVVWPTGMEADMFARLAAADQAQTTGPAPECPAPNLCPDLM